MKRANLLAAGFFGWCTPVILASCTSAPDVPGRDGGAQEVAPKDATAPTRDAVVQLSADAAAAAGSYCALPGSVVGTVDGVAVVAGAGLQLPDLSWLRVPVGYCAHHFANVAETRQLRIRSPIEITAPLWHFGPCSSNRRESERV